MAKKITLTSIDAMKYAEGKIIEKAQYPLADMYRQKILTKFNAFDIERAYDDGQKALTDKAIEWFKDNFVCLPPDFESMFREAMNKPSYEQNN